ncbi:hypothetical protein NDS46_31190 (plasmid) [Paenibacillus thiaminolyticus]|uniref:hypothetical protein n=1 Tax=Paenibacillus thiaminolyticus TaxID=49283 RepID=UPI00232C4F46|nr:hypothetical protein [Paenibacillus thiaminolyticus]WCF11424.1 hypothetical protein NDS46_31190 [Paenibacillus thiaminolyticus]
MSFALENQLKELQEQNKSLRRENERLQADFVNVEKGNIRLWKEKEESSYKHVLSAGELREKIDKLKEEKTIYRNALLKIGSKCDPPASKIANDALFEVHRM